jgi:hypothetical protein
MNSETIIQLRQQLEAIREFERKNASSRFSYAGYWAECISGLVLLGVTIFFRPPDAQIIALMIYYVVAVAFTFQGLYLIIRFKMDKRMKLLLEAMLSVGESRTP